MTTMAYKDYIGSADVSIEDGVLYGKLLGIRDLVTYEAETPAGLLAAFEEAVDDYLADCAAENREADRPYKGSLNVRIGPELHRELALEARRSGVSLNDLITRYLESLAGAHGHFVERRSAAGKRIVAEPSAKGSAAAALLGTPRSRPATGKPARHE